MSWDTEEHTVEIVERLNKEINAALADARIKARLADLGSTPLPARHRITQSCLPMKPRNGQGGQVLRRKSRVNAQQREMFPITFRYAATPVRQGSAAYRQIVPWRIPAAMGTMAKERT